MTKQQILDLLERSAWTFVQAFVAVLVASGIFDTGGDFEAWKAAAIAALLAAVKAVVAQQFGNGTAATVPVVDEPAWDVLDDEPVAPEVDE
jgi:hypothetical protein